MLPKGELTDILTRFRRVFYALGGFSLAINLLLLAPAIYMLQVYDRVLTSRNETTLVMLTLILVLMLMLEGGLEFIRSRIMVRVSAALDLKLNARVFDAAFARVLDGQGGSGSQSLSDMSALQRFVTGRGMFVFFDAPFTPVFVLVIFLLNPWLGLFALIAAVLLLVLACLNEVTTAPLMADAERRGVEANRHAAKQMRNAEVVAALGMIGNLRSRWLKRQSHFLAVHGHANDRSAFMSSVTRFARTVLQSAILGLGAYLVIENQLTPGGMIAASILLGRALAPVDLAISTWRNVVSARQSYARLNELLLRYPAAPVAVTELPRPQGRVSAEALVVAAPGTRTPILKGVRFEVPAGKVVAVVGPSASGKSSLARALVGVWRPMTGSVRLDGADVYASPREQMGAWMGYLPQDVELFDGTIAENIARFGVPDSERVVQAGRRSGVHDMVLAFPKGYDTVIGEGGLVLSGGQRQRIGLARAIYGDSAFIVLDEPDANLDESGEMALLECLRLLKEEQRTVFVVTHRAKVLSIADMAMVLVDGRIKAFGDRDQVLQPVPRKLPGKKSAKQISMPPSKSEDNGGSPS